MFFRMLAKSLKNRKSRTALAILAVMLGASIASALINVSLDIGDKVSLELRAYGANLLVVPKTDAVKIEIGGVDYTPVREGGYINESDLANIKTIFWRHNIIGFAPYLYAPVEVGSVKYKAVLVGAWFDKEISLPEGERFRTGVKKISPWWNVEGEWLNDFDESVRFTHRRPRLTGSMVGVTLARRLNLKIGDSLNVKYNGLEKSGSLPLKVVGIVSTGGFEDNQIFVNLNAAQELLGLPGKVKRVQVSALTVPEGEFAKRDPETMTPEEYERWYCTPYIGAIALQIEEAIPNVVAKPIRQIAESEGVLLGKVQLLMLLITIAALAASGLGVMSAMMTSAAERRIEVGLMKAIGAENGNILTLFLTEAVVIAALGGILGYGLGILFAQVIGISVFGATIAVKLIVLPIAMAISIVVALSGSALPIRNALSFQPATVLHGN